MWMPTRTRTGTARAQTPTGRRYTHPTPLPLMVPRSSHRLDAPRHPRLHHPRLPFCHPVPALVDNLRLRRLQSLPARDSYAGKRYLLLAPHHRLPLPKFRIQAKYTAGPTSAPVTWQRTLLSLANASACSPSSPALTPNLPCKLKMSGSCSLYLRSKVEGGHGATGSTWVARMSRTWVFARLRGVPL